MATPLTSSHSKPSFKIWFLTNLLILFTNFTTLSLSYSSYNSFATSTISNSKVSYTKYCNTIVPKASSNGVDMSESRFPELKTGFFVGGDRVLSLQDQNFSTPRSLVFRTYSVYMTDQEGVAMVEGALVFRTGNYRPYGYGNFSGKSRFRTKAHRFPIRRDRLSFGLGGFWSKSSGKLCMVGSGAGYSKEGNLLDLSAVFTLNFPKKNSTVYTSFVKGSLESVDSADSVNYFEPISVLVFSQINYVYTLRGFEGGDVEKNLKLGLESGRSLCSELFSYSGYELEYGSDCFGAKTCSPLGSSSSSSSSIGGLPELIYFNELQCSDQKKLRLLIGFPNTSYSVSLYNQPLVLGRMLIGEGVWDSDNNMLNVVACRLNYTDTSVNVSIGDCSIRLSLWFPAVMSIKSRSRVMGQLWSNRKVNESGYFEKIVFQSPYDRVSGVRDLKYEYTKIERVEKSCPRKTARKKGMRYPSGFSYDMKFDMKVKSKRGIHAWGYWAPLSVADQFYEHPMDDVQIENSMAPETSVQVNENHSSLLNISYSIRFTPDYNVSTAISFSNVSLNLNAPVEISAEGIYNSETGNLCMVACRYVKLSNNHSTDCEILINVQFRSSDSTSSEYVKGTMESTRGKLDPLYFEKLQLFSTSISYTQAGESVWRMDLEITMVLISNTLICIFVGLQIFYVRKYPDVLPSISLLMLAILTLGQMVPLVLNFEALFLTNRNRQNVMMGSGGWLEVNEVLVRVGTMVSFLLQFRLLQLTWSSRLGDGNQKGLVLAEKKALYVLLPLYLVGAFIAWGIHWWNNYHEAPLQYHNISPVYQGHSLWGDLRSYAGLLLDGFLLPQILFNLLWNSKDKALSPVFYIGITSVHLLPHAYDLYRAYRYVPYYDASYIYANPGGDFFSTAWDVIIPCGGLLFAILIYLQQRFGGCCLVPPRFRQSAVYEKVPVASGQ